MIPVSYTHLLVDDDYKKKYTNMKLTKDGCIKLNRKIMNSAFFAIKNLAEAFENSISKRPVSYTHLDVYKRQCDGRQPKAKESRNEAGALRLNASGKRCISERKCPPCPNSSPARNWARKPAAPSTPKNAPHGVSPP